MNKKIYQEIFEIDKHIYVLYNVDVFGGGAIPHRRLKPATCKVSALQLIW